VQLTQHNLHQKKLCAYVFKIRHHQRSALADPFHPRAKPSATPLRPLRKNFAYFALKKHVPKIQYLCKKNNAIKTILPRKRSRCHFSNIEHHPTLFRKTSIAIQHH
jgi:hypothetical protein